MFSVLQNALRAVSNTSQMCKFHISRNTVHFSSKQDGAVFWLGFILSSKLINLLVLFVAA